MLPSTTCGGGIRVRDWPCIQGDWHRGGGNCIHRSQKGEFQFHRCTRPPDFLYEAESFQADIYPPVLSSEPTLTAAEFFAGKAAPLNLVNLENGAIITSSGVVAAPAPVHVPAPTPAPPPAPEPIAVDIPPVTPVVATSVSVLQTASPQALSPPPVRSESFAAHSSHHHTSTLNEVCYMQLRSFYGVS